MAALPLVQKRTISLMHLGRRISLFSGFFELVSGRPISITAKYQNNQQLPLGIRGIFRFPQRNFLQSGVQVRKEFFAPKGCYQ